MVPRSENNHGDSLTNLRATMKFQFIWEIPVRHIANLRVQQPTRKVLRLDTSLVWKDPIIAYLKDGTLPGDRAEARKLQHLATKYILFGVTLYKKSYSSLHSNPYLRCLDPDKARKVSRKSTTTIVEIMRVIAPSPIRSSIKGITGSRCSRMPRVT